MDQMTPTRRKLSLRSRKQSNERTPTSKEKTKKSEVTTTPGNPQKGYNFKQNSPITPTIGNKTLSCGKTPKSRVNLLKSLYKQSESPAAIGLPGTQECEVEWDLDSPGFSRADLKKKHKEDKDPHILEPSPLPHRTLFTHQQTVSNKKEEKSIPTFSAELDRLLKINSLACNNSDMFQDSISPPSNNGFAGFGTTSDMDTDEENQIKPKILSAENFADISDDFFTDSILESTQAIENLAYNNNDNLHVKSNLKTGIGKNIINLTTSSIKSSSPSNVYSQSPRNVPTLPQSQKSQSVNDASVITNQRSNRLLRSSEKNFATRANSVDISATPTKPNIVHHQTTFRTHRSSFSLNPTTSYQQGRSSVIINKKNLSERFNSGSIRTNQARGPSKPIQYNLNNDVPTIAKNQVTADRNKNFVIPSKNNSPSVTQNKLLNDIKSKQISSAKYNDLSCSKNNNLHSSMTEGSNNQSTAVKEKKRLSPNVDESPRHLAKRSKSMADFSPIVDRSSIVKRADSFDIRNTSQVGSVHMFSDEDDSLFDVAMCNLEEIEKEHCMKSTSLNSIGSKCSVDDILMGDEDEELFGSETLEIITQIEKSAMNKNSLLELVKTPELVQSKVESINRFPSAKFKKSTEINCPSPTSIKEGNSIHSSTSLEQTFPPVGNLPRSFQLTGRSGNSLTTLVSQRSKHAPGIYSLKEIALKKEEAIKRRTKMARNKSLVS